MLATQNVFKIIDPTLSRTTSPGFGTPLHQEPERKFQLAFGQATQRLGSVPDRSSRIADTEPTRTSTEPMSSTSSTSDVRDTKRLERKDRVDDARPGDNDKTESTQAMHQAKRREAKKKPDDAQDADSTDETEKPSDSADTKKKDKAKDSDDATSAEAIVAAVMMGKHEATKADDAEVAAKSDASTADATHEASPLAVAAVAVVGQQAIAAQASEADPSTKKDASADVLNAPANAKSAGQKSQSNEAKPAAAGDATLDAAAKAIAASQGAAQHHQSKGGDGQPRDGQQDPTKATDAKQNAHHAVPAAIDPTQAAVANAAATAKPASSDAPQASTVGSAVDRLTAMVDATQSATAQATSETKAPAAPVSPEQKFARDNFEQLLTSVRTQAATAADGTASGNQMNIKLAPPELGALDIAVKMVDGKMSASFTTSNDQATQLLSHNLGQLKSTLEASGVQIDRIQVRQTSETTASSSSSNEQGSGGRSSDDGRTAQYDGNAQQNNQQRRDAVERMWKRFAYGADDLDLVA